MAPPPTHTELPRRPQVPGWRAVYDRVAPGLALLILVIALAAGVGTYFNDRAITKSNSKRIEDNTANAVTQCENANESREAARALWGYVVDLSAARNEHPTPGEVAFVAAFRDYVDAVYQTHDCDRLDKKYPLPPPPTIPAQS